MRISKLSRSSRGSFLTYGFVIAVYIILQTMARGGNLSASVKGMLVPICAYVVMAVSLNLVVGISGELSLGHAGFMSVGAFTGVTAAMALQNVVSSGSLRLLIGMLVGAFFAAVAGVLVGIPVLRLKGDYLAIVTLAFGEIIKSIVTNLYVGVDSRGLHVSLLTNKLAMDEGGKIIINGPMGITTIEKLSTLTAGFLLVMITLVIVFNLINSRTGRAIMAIRDNRIAAESVGVNITKYRMIAFASSAAMAGAAGTLFAMNYSTIIASKFDFNTSILVLVFVVFGGLGNMFGSIVAAAALTILPEALRGFATYRMLIYAIVLILLMLATNSETLKNLIARIIPRQKEGAEDA